MPLRSVLLRSVLLLSVSVAVACLGGEPARELPEPAGEERYREILAEEAGVGVGAVELARLAAGDSLWISGRMDRLAAAIAPGGSPGEGGWREVFARLRADHPRDVEEVLAAYRAEVERARSFVLARGLITLPPGPLTVEETPAYLAETRYPLIAYLGYRLAVTAGDGERLADHCRVCIPPLAVHETYPGHHAAFLHQRSGAGPDAEIAPELALRAGEHFKNRFFHEGWGQYAEVLMLEAGYYDGEPERELGAWRNLLFRVERARIDALLHSGTLSPEAAAAELAGFLDPETAEAEVERHLAEPTLKAAYYVGLLQILELREAVAEADAEMDLRAFHDRLVRWPLPIPEIARERFGVEIGTGLPEEGLAGSIGWR
jgi:uncharacterized protein (DUF885 family)